MKKIIFNKITSLLILGFTILSCTDPYALQTNTFEDAIVVEATLTNEFKHQEIKLSRTYRFEEDGPTFETGAMVLVTDNLGNQYHFDENNGKYISTTEFQAVPNRNYQLHITAEDGRSYISTNEQLTTANEIQDLIPTVVTKEGVRGIQINAKSFDPTNTSKYYRYEYEETYKIIAPSWVPEEAVVTGPTSYQLTPWGRETKTCYKTEKSTDIILTSTNDLSEDRVDFTVRFISDKNPIISQRYSIFVRQYVQNLAAFTYYKTLKELSGSGDILSQNQPGFYAGNIKSMTNPNEKVIGFFDVSTVSSKRIFFNHSDLLPDISDLPYFTDCRSYVMNFCFGLAEGCSGEEIIQGLQLHTLTYFSGDFTLLLFPGPCGDCTQISSNIKPAFWID